MNAQTLLVLVLLFALFSLLCTVITTDMRVTKYYLAILACGDMGHLYANYKGMGDAVFWDFGRYNEVMWGNVGITVFLWCFRILTLAGVFGGRRKAEARALAIVTFSALLGATTFARLCSDEALSREILSTVAKHVRRLGGEGNL